MGSFAIVALATLVVVWLPASAFGQLVTANVLQRVFQLRHGSNIGSCFTFDVDGRQYLITARHLVETYSPGEQIEIKRDDRWVPVSAKVFFPSPKSVDIAVLALAVQISPDLPLPAERSVLALSQDMYFLGFPYGLSTDAQKLNAGFPLPFVKRGTLAAFAWGEGGAEILVIDGLGNPGFSGGPVVYQDPGRRQLTVAGVVSGYRFQEDTVFQGGKQTPMSVRSNSGLLLAYGIKTALDLIRDHPVGAPIALGR